MDICCLISITGTYFVGLIGLKRRNTFSTMTSPENASWGGLKRNHWIKKKMWAVCGNFLHVSNISVHFFAISCPYHINHFQLIQRYLLESRPKDALVWLYWLYWLYWLVLDFVPRGFNQGPRIAAPLWMQLSALTIGAVTQGMYWEGTLSDSTNC